MKLQKSDVVAYFNAIGSHNVYVTRSDGSNGQISKEDVIRYIEENERRLVVLACHVADGTTPKRET